MELTASANTGKSLPFNTDKNIYWNLTPEELIEHTIKKKQGVLSDTGALCIETGKFTGRTPKDRFIVLDEKTQNSISWGGFNTPIKNEIYQNLKSKVYQYLSDRDVYARELFACADAKYRLSIQVITEYPWSNMFANNMFIRPTVEELAAIIPDWIVVCAPGFEANPAIEGTRSPNFVIVNFTEKQVIIGGTAYTGEIKKSIFSILNYILPFEKNVLSMHCSANVGKGGDTAVFFGLSGTGKTTLSADPERNLVGDDEHGWSEEGIFNFEGGCYAKTINLSPEGEPEIFNAIKHGAIVENIQFFPGTRNIDYSSIALTENTRVSYPLHHIPNALIPSKAGLPSNIFFLTCDSFGILPPISKLSKGQAMYHFISGYTAKIAGTEEGVKEPTLTFSACFGAPFLPLHPTKYAEMLGKKMEQNKVNVWLINTGWSGGSYGVGSRMKLKYTRAMITAALNGELNNVGFNHHEVFGMSIPASCPNVPFEILNPKNTWADKNAYDKQAKELAAAFVKNFEQYAENANEEIMNAAPNANI
jgi:phosphoenolpyruvate carboxykinase (ATP)